MPEHGPVALLSLLSVDNAGENTKGFHTYGLIKKR